METENPLKELERNLTRMYVFPLSSYLLTPQLRILGKPSLRAHRVPLRRSALAEPGFFIVLRVSAPGVRIDPGVVKPLSLSCSFGLLLLLPSSVDERRRTSAPLLLLPHSLALSPFPPSPANLPLMRSLLLPPFPLHFRLLFLLLLFRLSFPRLSYAPISSPGKRRKIWHRGSAGIERGGSSLEWESCNFP